MKLYLDLEEVLPETSLLTPETMRADITDKTDAEVADIQADMESVMSGHHYTIKKHYCLHDIGGSCTADLIKEV